MNKITLEQKKRGLKEELTYVNANGKISKEYRYKGMVFKWDNWTLKGKFYYWRDSFYTSLDACMEAVDRHNKIFKNKQHGN